MNGHAKVREALKSVYPKAKGWHRKVDKMSDAQVVAVYYRFYKEGKVT